MTMTTQKITDFLAANNVDPNTLGGFAVQNNFGDDLVIDEKPVDDFYTCLQVTRQQFEEKATKTKMVTASNNSKIEIVLFSWRKERAAGTPKYTDSGDTGVIVNTGAAVYVDVFSDKDLNKQLGALISNYIVK